MPKRNYGYEKRQKELNKQRKQETKRQRRLDRTESPPEAQKIEPAPPTLPPEDQASHLPPG